METWSRTWKNEIASSPSPPMLSSYSTPTLAHSMPSLLREIGEGGHMWKGRKRPKWLVSHVKPLGYTAAAADCGAGNERSPVKVSQV